MEIEPADSMHSGEQTAAQESLNAQPVRVQRHRAMGTEFCLYMVAEAEACGADGLGERERTLAQAVWAEVDRVEAVFSRFRESSEIARLNRLAALGPVVTDPEVFSLLLEGQRLWKLTGGAFDIALGRLSRAWGFAERQPQMPEEAERVAAEEAAGMALVKLDPEWRTVRFTRPGVELDLGGFAKGYAVDCALAVLRAAGTAALVDAGRSSIGAVGEPFESAWKVEVRGPSALADGCDGETVRVVDAVALHGRALGSSGMMEQKFEQDGRVYAHVFDPRGLSAEAGGRVQTTVLAQTAAEADALSTALYVLGPEAGAAVVDRMKDCAALWVLAGDGKPSWHARNWPQTILPWGEAES